LRSGVAPNEHRQPQHGKTAALPYVHRSCKLKG
jgi:hypothetical protein